MVVFDVEYAVGRETWRNVLLTCDGCGCQYSEQDLAVKGRDCSDEIAQSLKSKAVVHGDWKQVHMGQVLSIVCPKCH